MQNRLINNNNFAALRDDFPILQTLNRGKPLIYLDNAATAQKPHAVIRAMDDFYRKDNANIHRGLYELSERLSVKYETIRAAVKDFIHAEHADEIVFVQGTTEGINLVAQSFGRPFWQAGDEVIISEMEHHSNIVPWYLLQEQIGICLKVIPITDSGELDLTAYQQLFSPRTKLVALAHASNVLGTINPVQECIALAHAHGVPVLLDGAQVAPHLAIDMQALDCDFYVFSAHKLYGPTGIGVLYAKQKWLQQMVPYQSGGGMIASVSFTNVSFANAPHKFEAGTPNIAAVIGLQAAITYLNRIGLNVIAEHEQQLVAYTQSALQTVPGLRLIGTAKKKLGVFSFVLDHIHPHDIGTVLDLEGIAIRAGHHCAMPLMQRYQVPATVRASIALYNTQADIDALIAGLHLARRLFR